MENLLDIMKLFSNNKEENIGTTDIPKEVIDQYPYGEFPLKYTRSGQETIRKQSENRFLNTQKKEDGAKENTSFDIGDLSSILPLVEILSNDKKKDSNYMFEILSKLMFKDKPELQKLIKLFTKQKNHTQEVNHTENFPDTNKICISSLKKIN